MIRRIAALVFLASLAGCARLRPWERGPLMERCMVATPDPLEAALDAHLHATREGIQGASGAGAASCGCN